MRSPDLLIIGGGAAGLSAAATAQGLGLSVKLVDERPALGGNIYAGVGTALMSDGSLGDDYVRGSALLAAASVASMSPSTLAWRIEKDGQTFVLSETGPSWSITPRRLLIATGAMERPVPVPGATLPGVMYAGAAQLLLKSAAVVPAGRVALVGSGPLLLLLAKQLLSFDIRQVSLVETTPCANFWAVLRSLQAGLNAPDMILKGFGLQRAIEKAGISWYRHATNVSVAGLDRAERVEFTDGSGRQQKVEADLVLLHDGVIPNDQLSRQLGCRERWNASQHCFSTFVDAWGETSRPGIFAAGDCTGIWGARAAELAGELAALEIARQLGRITHDQRDKKAGKSRWRLRRQKAFRPFLEMRFPPTIARADMAADDTVICRCEDVRAGDIRLSIAQGATGPDQLKSFTRCFMGPCQGRTCGMAAAEIMAMELSKSIGEIGRHSIRAPVKPLPLGRIAVAGVADRE